MGFSISGSDFSSVSRGALQGANMQKEADKAEKFSDELNKAIGKDKSEDKTTSEKTDKEKEKANQEAIDQKNKELKEASIKFEAFFLNQVMKGMRDTVERSDLFGDSFEMDIYEDMLDEALTEKAAETGGVGLADMIYEEHKFEYEG
ncbi:rod-binding protein [Natranaerofaba carboxydovora]|uniref:rod-binding protein n=1 Tax=Natranaerofaba carboxydovora TaxID=2742683 RepID=UPI001F13873C|nr:rod-binding protein [Natranaerofaba carboxydovora]UMZ75091.1 Rod binding protein [Natranaerofaba carboxydovora]